MPERTEQTFAERRRVRWLGAKRATKSELRDALVFWVERAERFETHIPSYMTARGVLSKHYALGKAAKEAARRA